MTIYERIRFLRKEKLGLTQAKFGEILGVNRSTINNIEGNYLVKPEQKEPLYRLICKEFGVDYRWLMTGEGEMLSARPECKATKLADEMGLDGLPRQALEFYLSLDEAKQNALGVVFEDFIQYCIDNPDGGTYALPEAQTPSPKTPDLAIPDGMTEDEALEAVHGHFARQKKAPGAGGDKGDAEKRFAELERRLKEAERREAKKDREIEALKKEIEEVDREIEAEHSRLAQQFEDVG